MPPYDYAMISRRLFTRFALAAAALSTAVPAYAHRQKISYTDIEWLADSSEIGVTHRIHMHDAVKALVKQGKLDSPTLTDLRSQAILALHLKTQFALYGQDEKRIGLDVLGAEIQGSDIFIFMTGKVDGTPKGLSIFCEILHATYASQRNHVTVNLQGEIHTVTFQAKDPVKTVF